VDTITTHLIKKLEFRTALNEIINDYSDGFVLLSSGEIVRLSPDGLDSLLNTLPETQNSAIHQHISNAVRKFRERHASVDDRHAAVRSLADVLELIRPQLQRVITKQDESDLFQIANNFGIRHSNDRQKNEYERGIWLDWIFFHYLATIHTVLRRLSL
jgi:hypothetical protein